MYPGTHTQQKSPEQEEVVRAADRAAAIGVGPYVGSGGARYTSPAKVFTVRYCAEPLVRAGRARLG